MRKWNNDKDYVVASMYNVYCYNMFLDDFPRADLDLLRAIDNSVHQQVIRNYRKIEGQQRSDTWFPYGYYGISEELVSALFDALGRDRLRRIAQVFLQDRWLCSKGWPDLLIMKGDAIRLFEVKTTDRLHIRQIIVMPEMIEAGQLLFEIVRIKKPQRRSARGHI